MKYEKRYLNGCFVEIQYGDQTKSFAILEANNFDWISVLCCINVRPS